MMINICSLGFQTEKLNISRERIKIKATFWSR